MRTYGGLCQRGTVGKAGWLSVGFDEFGYGLANAKTTSAPRECGDAGETLRMLPPDKHGKCCIAFNATGQDTCKVTAT